MTMSHEQATQELAEHLGPLFEESPDGVYIWLDEANKRCNERLAALFGCTVEGWRATTDFAHTFVADADRGLYVWNYQNRVGPLAFPVTFRFQGRRLDGSTFEAETDMIPLTYGGHTFAFHFVRALAT